MTDIAISASLRMRLSAEPAAPVGRLTRHQRAQLIDLGRTLLEGRRLSHRRFGWVCPEIDEHRVALAHAVMREFTARGIARADGATRAPDLTARGWWMWRSLTRNARREAGHG